jgi:tetratricopeptide (TPR) repeat protein
MTLCNIATVFRAQKKYNTAMDYYQNALGLLEKIGDKQKIATVQSNIAVLYEIKGDVSGDKTYLEKALQLYLLSLKTNEEINYPKGIAFATNNVGNIYFKLKNYGSALKYLLRSKEISTQLGYPENIRNVAKNLKDLYLKTGDHKNALQNLELFVQMRDSINNESTRKASIKSQLKYEFEKQAAADSVAHAKENEIKNAELAKQKAEISAKKNQQYALFGGLGLVLVFAGFMYNRFKITQKQKKVIEEQKSIVEEQKKLVEEKQKEVLDSIHYARRIQQAQMPNEKMVSKIFKRLKK